MESMESVENMKNYWIWRNKTLRIFNRCVAVCVGLCDVISSRWQNAVQWLVWLARKIWIYIFEMIEIVFVNWNTVSVRENMKII